MKQLCLPLTEEILSHINNNEVSHTKRCAYLKFREVPKVNSGSCLIVQLFNKGSVSNLSAMCSISCYEISLSITSFPGHFSLDRDPPLNRDPLGQRPPDRDPPWTETPWTETTPIGQKPPRHRPPFTETPSWTETPLVM